MSKKKQTAFEWYIEQHNILVQVCENMPVDERFKRFSSLVNKVKEMEKKQIEDAYQAGQDNVDYTACFVDENGLENYYNETYGGNK
jgi:hypothetical protein